MGRRRERQRKAAEMSRERAGRGSWSEGKCGEESEGRGRGGGQGWGAFEAKEKRVKRRPDGKVLQTEGGREGRERGGRRRLVWSRSRLAAGPALPLCQAATHLLIFLLVLGLGGKQPMRECPLWVPRPSPSLL